MRTVTPQWGKGKNLGEFNVNPKEMTESDLGRILEDATLKSALLDTVNMQLHIRFASKLITDAVRKRIGKVLNEKGETPKADEYFAMTHADAKAFAEEIVKTQELDYVQAFETWAREDFANRGKSKQSSFYAQAKEGISSNWERLDESRRQRVIDTLGLEISTSATMEEALEALAAKHGPKSLEDLFKL